MAFTSNPIASIAVKRGPIGPTGLTGPQGATGPAGPQGESFKPADVYAYIGPVVQAAIGNDFDLVSIYQLNT